MPPRKPAAKAAPHSLAPSVAEKLQQSMDAAHNYAKEAEEAQRDLDEAHEVAELEENTKALAAALKEKLERERAEFEAAVKAADDANVEASKDPTSYKPKIVNVPQHDLSEVDFDTLSMGDQLWAVRHAERMAEHRAAMQERLYMNLQLLGHIGVFLAYRLWRYGATGWWITQ